MKNLHNRHKTMMQTLSPMSEVPYHKHITQANELVVDLARAGEAEKADELADRIHFLTEGWQEELTWTIQRIRRAFGTGN